MYDVNLWSNGKFLRKYIRNLALKVGFIIIITRPHAHTRTHTHKHKVVNHVVIVGLHLYISNKTFQCVLVTTYI